MEHSRISRDPDIMVGKPCITGTRITVEHILRQISHGATIKQLPEDYPRLTHEDILAAMAYAADRLRGSALADAGIDGSLFNSDDGWIVCDATDLGSGSAISSPSA